jgi:hypothetical protein
MISNKNGMMIMFPWRKGRMVWDDFECFAKVGGKVLTAGGRNIP